MKSLFKFYLKNFRVIHHLVFISMTFGVLKILSMILPFYEVIFKLNPFGVFLQLVTLALCFYFNEKALNKAGLTDEYMNREFEKLEKKKR